MTITNRDTHLGVDEHGHVAEREYVVIPRDEKRQILKNEVERLQRLADKGSLNLTIRCDDPEQPGDTVSADYWPGVIEAQAYRLVALAAEHNVVLTVSQVPTVPLAMGRYETVVETRPSNPNARQESES